MNNYLHSNTVHNAAKQRPLPGFLRRFLLGLMTSSLCFTSSLHASDNALPVEAGNFDPANAVDVIRSAGVNPVMDINHNVDRAILNWNSFDIGRNATVNFNQLSQSSLTLNRIFQGSASQIFGQLNANGRIFLINQNGILFGDGAQINVHELTASTLNITDEIFENGILSAIENQDPAFTLFTDTNGNPLPSQKIIIENGAELNSGVGGRIMILAPDIENNGIINTPEGQTILAAGNKVYLTGSDDPSLRGILVEVNSGGEVLNLGEINSDRGNITLAGLAINQNGRLTATTTTSANGSIRLISRDTDLSSPFVQNTNTIVTNNTGEVTLGEDSVIEILAELDNPDMAVDDQIQYSSRVEIVGEKIHLKENSLISAKGGEVNITAVADPSSVLPQGNNPVARNDDVVVQMEAGSRIDVSGNSTTLDMSRNNITVELRGNELRDLPLQRDGALRGERVVVDVRRADEFELGDISGNLAGIERNVAERTAAGGEVVINSEGDIRFLDGAEIDVSGGKVNYRAGDIQTTVLQQGTELVDIHDADPNQLYDGVASINTNFETAYVEGKDAGTVQFSGHGLIVDGTLTGNAVAGRYQRTENTRPQGGRLLIGLPQGQGIDDFRAPNITLQDLNLSQQLGGFNIDIAQGYADVDASVPGFAEYRDELLLSFDFLKDGGFTRAELNSNGIVALEEGNGSALVLRPNSQLTFRGDRVEVNRSVASQSGDFEFIARNVNVFSNISPVTVGSGIAVDNNVTLDVSGAWINDDPIVSGVFLPTSPAMLDGGSISFKNELVTNSVVFGDDVSLLAYGGAQLNSTGEFIGGRGGDISIELLGFDTDLQFGSNNVIAAHGVKAGGSLTLAANVIEIADMSPNEWRTGQSSLSNSGITKLPDYFFSDLGFSQFDIRANQGDLIIASGANIDLKRSQLFIPVPALNLSSRSLSSLLALPSSSSLRGIRESQLQSGIAGNSFLGFAPDYEREAAALKLSAINQLDRLQQTVSLSEGAMISTDAGSNIEFNNISGGWINIGGIINAPGSDISMSLSRPADLPFDSSSAVLISENASIDTSATFVSFPDFDLGLNQATVFNGGDIEIQSSGAILIKSGAVLDTSASSARFDVTGGITSRQITRNKLIASEAGNITLSSSESILIDGDLNLASANSSSYAGTLSLALDRGLRGSIQFGLVFPVDPVNISLTETTSTSIPASFQIGDDLDPALNGQSLLSVAKVENSGSDSLNLRAVNGSITLDGDINLSLRRNIVLDAPLFVSSGNSSRFEANYVAMGSSAIGSSDTFSALPSTGAGQFQINAGQIELIGLSILQNIGQVDLVTPADIRMRGVGSRVLGEYLLDGDLNMTASRIYPTTMSDFAIDAGNGDITLRAAVSGDQQPVLSAGGRLTFKANNLYQDGNLYAPQGELNFDIEDSLIFEPGSITSVSAADSNILLGQTLNGLEFLYVTSSLNNARTIYSAAQQNMPEKNIVLDARNIDIADDATLDLTGGGDLYNWEFIPGPGGSVDALDATNADNFFAVLPDIRGFAPFDSQEFRGWNLEAGDSVFLAAGNGLASGNYAVLPARYALLPGAFLVERVEGFDNIPLNQSSSSLFNGTLVAGYETVFGTSIQESTTSGYIIRDGSYANQLAEYNASTADQVVADIAAANNFTTPRLTRDSGSLSIIGQDSINLNGNLLTAAGIGGRGALVDISADILSVVQTSGTGVAGSTEILASSVNDLGAESILIGGRRSFTSSGTDIDVAATDLTVVDGVELDAPEVILVAGGDLLIESGTKLSGIGDIQSSGEIYNLNGDSSLARVSAAPQAQLNRTNTTGTGTSLTIEADVNLLADRSITLDSSGDLISDANIGANVDEFSLGASSISIGDVDVASGLIINDEKLAQIAGLDLVLRTDGQIDFYGTANLLLNNLEINATGLVADQTTPAVVIIDANSVNFGNASGNLATTSIPAPTGSLTINSNELNLNEGSFSIEGFNSIDANITGDTTGSGVVSLAINGDLNLTTQRLTAVDYSDVTINTTGNLSIDRYNGISLTDELQRQIGSRFVLEGENVFVDTVVDASVGIVDILARTGDVVLGQNTVIDTSGYSIDVLGIDEIALPGGDVNLTATMGNIESVTGSTINVSSGGAGRAAGTVRFNAVQGDVSILGDLTGTYPVLPGISPDVELGGGFYVDAATLGQSLTSGHTFAQLNSRLNSGAFSRERVVRQRTGDLNIDLSNDFLLAQNIKLVAETGDIRVSRANLWTADEQQGGVIELIAGNDLIMDTGSWLSVAPLPGSATVDNARGGEIILESVNGDIDLRSGFLQVGSIGNDDTVSGTVNLRVSRNASNNDININNLSSVLLGGNEINVEAVKRYDDVAVVSDAYLSSTVQPDTDAFMANESAITGGLPLIYLDQSTGAVRFDGQVRLKPGVELRNDGNVVVADNLDFSTWRYNDEPGVFTIRATGDIDVNGNINDGVTSVAEESCFFGSCTPTGNFIESVQTGNSWSYRFVAGSDKTTGTFSVDSSLFDSSSGGDFTLASGKLIRTGTGDITVAAAGDINFGDQESVIYTLGKSSDLNLDSTADSSTKLVPVDSGDITLVAGNNINGAGDSSSTTQLVNEWYKRQLYIEPIEFFGQIIQLQEDAGTWLDFANFQQGIASFGGGNVNVSAGNDISRLSVSTPTWVVGDYDTREVSRHGNGNITFNADGDIVGGIFFVGDGTAKINAGGDVVGGRTQLSGGVPLEMDTTFALMGGDIDLFANGDIKIESVFNPTLLVENNEDLIFSTYQDASASFVSLNGDVTVDPGFADIQQNTTSLIDPNNAFQFSLMPGSLQLVSVTQNVILEGGQIDIFPSLNGNIELYAGTDIIADNFSTILMSDEPLSLIPDLNSTISSTSDLRRIVNSRLFSDPPLHSNDAEPSWFVAENGDISNGVYIIPEQSRFFAGRDLNNIRLLGQNINAGDVTRVQAGRDIRLSGGNQTISASGPGRLDVLAGRNIDLGPSIGVETRGNLVNPVLADVGADINIMAGIGDGPEYLDFYRQYIETISDEEWQQNIESLIPEVIDTFYTELRAAGRDASGDFSRGFQAIDVLFPESQFNRVEAYGDLALKLPGESNQHYFERLAELSDYQGDLSLFFSRVYSLDGGDINMLVPGGFVNAGLASAPANAPVKEPGELGVVAQGTGDIRTFSRGDFQVNQSRVSTLLGGDILMWSSIGNIDAGRGSKSAIAAPEPRITITSSGDVQVDLSNTISGSGIRAVVVDPSVEPGDVDLIAPNGIVDAGDAGIASSGNINIAAVQVIGADNIQFGGVAVGVPTSNTGSVGGAGFSGAGNVAGNASRVAEDAASDDENQFPLRQEVEEPQLTFISVEVLGFGDEEEES